MRVLLLFISVLTTNFVFAQTPSDKVVVEWGEQQKASKRSTVNNIVGFDSDGGVYVQKVEYKKMGIVRIVTIEYFDENMNFINSGVIGDAGVVVDFNNKLYVFSSISDKKADKNTFYSQSVDKESLLVNADKQELAQIDFEGFRNRNDGSFGYEFSGDSTKLLVYYNLPYDKRGVEKVGVHVYDQQMDQLWRKTITIPYTDELFTVEDFEVDNEGNVYVTGVEYNEKLKIKRKGKPNFKYHVLSYTNQGKEENDLPIEVDGKFLTDMKVRPNNDGQLLCGGFYSGQGTYSVEGSFFLKVNASNGDVETASFEDFGIDFITQNLTARQEKKARKKDAKGKTPELFQFDLDAMVMREDGGVVLVAEQYFVKVVTTTTTGANGAVSTTTNYHYYYNDLIVISVSPEGEIEWNTKIPKFQHTVNDGGYVSSYAMAVVDDKLNFIFNDNPKNLNLVPGQRVRNFGAGKETLVVLVTVDSNGQLKKEPLFSIRDTDVVTVPKVCKQIGDRELVIFGKRKKTQRLGVVNFK